MKYVCRGCVPSNCSGCSVNFDRMRLRDLDDAFDKVSQIKVSDNNIFVYLDGFGWTMECSRHLKPYYKEWLCSKAIEEEVL